jgi:hypothetical protein
MLVHKSVVEGNDFVASPQSAQLRDWAKIKSEYEDGGTYVREIGRRHGVSHPAILKRAAAEKWIKPVTSRGYQSPKGGGNQVVTTAGNQPVVTSTKDENPTTNDSWWQGKLPKRPQTEAEWKLWDAIDRKEQEEYREQKVAEITAGDFDWSARNPSIVAIGEHPLAVSYMDDDVVEIAQPLSEDDAECIIARSMFGVNTNTQFIKVHRRAIPALIERLKASLG